MLGTVTVLRRYPVKSMLGEDVDAGEVTFTGLAGDRRLAVVSRTTGKIASAKFPVSVGSTSLGSTRVAV